LIICKTGLMAKVAAQASSPHKLAVNWVTIPV
jgi:hypothetical protein